MYHNLVLKRIIQQMQIAIGLKLIRTEGFEIDLFEIIRECSSYRKPIRIFFQVFENLIEVS